MWTKREGRFESSKLQSPHGRLYDEGLEMVGVEPSRVVRSWACP